MGKYKIFVDGSSGTTGLRIADRLAERPEFTILPISEADRKDVHARAAVINESNLSFLCLPDDAAREVVPLLRPDVRVLDTLELCLRTVTPMLATMTPLPANMRRAAAKGFINATDCADYLTKKGMPFRDAYKCTGTMVAACIREGKTLEELTMDEFKQYSDLFAEDVYTAIDLTTCCEGRTSYGGPTKASVLKQIELVKEKLA